MSIEQTLIEIIGISVVLYFCIKTLILSTVRAYKEIYIEIHQSVLDIKKKNHDLDLELNLEDMKLYKDKINQ